MIGKIVLIVTAACAGVLTASYLIGQPLLTINNVYTFIQDGTKYIQQNFIAFLTGMVPAVVGLSTLASKLLGRKEQTIQTLQSTNEQQGTALNAMYQELQTKMSPEEALRLQEKYGENFTETVTKISRELEQTKTALKASEDEIKLWEQKQDIWDKTRLRLEEDVRSRTAKIKRLEYDLGVLKGEIIPQPK